MTLALPYQDDTRTPLAFSLAILLHVLLGMAIVGFFLFKPAKEPEQRKVFELVAAPQSDSTTDEAAAASRQSLTMPNLSVPNIPAPSQPSQPTPPTPAQPTPTPAVVKPPVPAALMPTHGSTVVKQPTTNQPQLSAYQKFLKDHHISNSPAPTRGTSRPVPTVSVNVSSMVNNLENAGSGSHGQSQSHANAASSAEEQNYIDKLRERLKEAFVPPGGMAGLSAEVQLVIAPDGELVKKWITRKSGKAEFDDAVNEALQQLTNVDPPPGGQQVSYNFTYTPDQQ